jgi:lipopolysaccharide export system protein LptA
VHLYGFVFSLDLQQNYMMYHKFFFILIIVFNLSLNAQQKRIKIIHADNSSIDEEHYPGATILLGNVLIEHEGVSLHSKKAIHYKKDNFLQAYGKVVLNQGDTIVQSSNYAEYNGNTKHARSWGNVVLNDQSMVLKTDTLNFDRINQVLFYKSGATIKDSANVLKSNRGNYYLRTTKFQALSDVVLTNPDYVLKSNYLDYYTNNGQAFLSGPSTITSKSNKIYCEKGYYDTKSNISHFSKNAKIAYKDRTIEADSIFYDRNKGFASATNNIKIKDTINKSFVRGNYAEYFQLLDSAFVIKRALATHVFFKKFYIVVSPHYSILLFTGN